ncbi:MAG: hypothetical protein COT74_02915 [Bdellovibrionales bacterium CG10_big_fil_rev_8_21_14_0_10_45_34]|nr:MAG: hypothetical protein COT74_02915 [Bdellovibrionales bacterium CG10_big_fil_rev_8_21_14_0_10_45_34]
MILILTAIRPETEVVLEVYDLKKDQDKIWRGTHDSGHEVLLWELGMGHELALKKFEINQSLFANLAVDHALVFGYCGGLRPTLRLGDVFIPERVIAEDAVRKEGPVDLHLDMELCDELGRSLLKEGITYRVGPLVTAEKVVQSPEDKINLFRSTGAEAVDMEVFPLVRALRRHKISVVVVKAILDDSRTALPDINSKAVATQDGLHYPMAEVSKQGGALQKNLKNNLKRAAPVLKKTLPVVVDVLLKNVGL